MPGDVADAEHRRRSSARPATRIDLLVNNASLLGPSPQPALADYPLDELRRVYEVNVLAPLALVQLALPRLGAGRGDPQRHLRRGASRPTRAGAATAPRRRRSSSSPRSSRPSTPTCASTRSIPATCARGCTRRRSPARTSPTARRPRRACPGLLALIEGELPSGRYRARELGRCRGMSAPRAALPAAPRPTRPPRRGAPVATTSRCSSPRAPTARSSHTRFPELPRFLAPGDLLVVNTSATLPAALPARLDGREIELRLSTPAGREAPGWSSCVRAADPLPRPPVGARLELPGGARRSCSRPTRAASGCASPAWSSASRWTGYLAPRPADPLPLRPEPWPLEAYQTVFAREPGSAEMPSAGRPFTAELVRELVASGVLVAPITLHTGVSSLELRRAPLPRALPRPGVHGAAGQRRPRLGRARGRGRDDGRARAGDRRRAGRRRRRRARAGRASSSAPSAGCARSTACSRAGTSPRPRTCACSRPSAGAELLARSYRAAVERGYLWHEFGDVHLILP